MTVNSIPGFADPFSSILHLLAAVVFCVLGFFLVARGRGSMGRMFSIFFDSIPEWLGLSIYLGMGWLGLLSGILLGRRFGLSFVKPLVCSGLAYSLGGITEYFAWPILIPGVIGPHEIFHVAVIVGIGIHWYFIYQCLDKAGKLP